jgi:hypothetical protein
MFYERVPIIKQIGTTIAQIFDQYDIPEERFDEIINLPVNESLRRTTADRLTLTTSLSQGSGSICLPIDFYVASYGIASVKPAGSRPQPLGSQQQTAYNRLLKQCTHGLDVKFARYYLDGRDANPCKRIRWIQTVTKINDVFSQPPINQPSEFVDVGGSGGGGAWPWFDFDYGWDTGQVTVDDNPCGPPTPTPGGGLKFRATTSAVVWTTDRVTLVSCFTYGFSLKPGSTIGAVLWDPFIRKATDAEVQNQIRILKAGINNSRQPTGGSLNYQPPPAEGAVN